MSGSETGAVVTTTEQFTVGVQKSPPPAQPLPVVQNMHLSYSSDGTALYKPISGSSPPPYQSIAAAEVSASPVAVFPPQQNLNMNLGESVKRKRGRPRKYGPDGSMALAPTPSPASAQPLSGAFSSPLQSPQPAISPLGGSASGSSTKKARGRPPGSSKKQQMEAMGKLYIYVYTDTYFLFIYCGFIVVLNLEIWYLWCIIWDACLSRGGIWNVCWFWLVAIEFLL